eukprot:scaffold795_cov187-Amphora_coffeaeformis.AAC.12
MWQVRPTAREDDVLQYNSREFSRWVPIHKQDLFLLEYFQSAPTSTVSFHANIVQYQYQCQYHTPYNIVRSLFLQCIWLCSLLSLLCILNLLPYLFDRINHIFIMPEKDSKNIPTTTTSSSSSSSSSNTDTKDSTDTDTDNNGKDDASSTWGSFRTTLSSSTSLFSNFRETIDAQRIERLKQCQSLQGLLQACREKRPDRAQLEDFPMGIRSVRYFQWRHGNENSHTRGGASASNGTATNSCVREEHALWTCRGVALKCGGEVVRLRDCFQEYSAEELLHPDNEATAYENNNHTTNATTTTTMKKKKKITPPCAEFQQALGTCVTQNAAALAERQQQYKNK